MPLTPIACPNCGNILQANSLEKEGVVGTPCRECGETVFVHTDEEGRVEAIYAGSEGLGAGHHAAFEAAFEEEDFLHHSPRKGGIRSFIPLLMGLLALGLLLWVGSTVFCTRAPRQAALATPEPEEIIVRTSPTPTASATPFVLNRESGVVFDTGKAELLSESRARLEDLAKKILATPSDRVFEIAGHTDDTGDEEANHKLSLARAQAVKAYLRRLGVPSERLTVKGYGATRPAGDNRTTEGRERNRRIEIIPSTRTTRDLAAPE